VKERNVMHDKIMDKRVVERLLHTGSITEDQVHKYRENLPDVSEDAEELIIEIKRK
jgi:hypothetical protein